jgi:PEP-CTERM motif-containing protein
MINRAVYRGMLCLALAGASLQASSLVLGDPPMLGTGNCDPFGCPGFLGLGTYQQVYLSTAFPGAISIAGLTFFEGQVLGNGGLPAGGTYTLSFAYTSLAPGDLNLTNPSANIGSGGQLFFNGALPALTTEASGNELIITGAPFVYNPADGNLLLSVTITGAFNAGPALYLNEAACGPKTACPAGSSVVSSNAYFGSLNGTPVSGGNDVGGLVTGFDYSTVGAVPEPGSLLLVLAGIGLIGLRKKPLGTV